jgi:hypothetical protein
LFVAALEFNFIGLAISMASWSDAWMMYAMVAVCLVSTPIMGAIMFGFLLFFRLPCDMVADRIRQEVARVKATDATSADWNAIMGGVQQAHEATVRIGALMWPPLMAFQIVSVAAGSWWFACSVFPHDDLPPNHPMRTYFTGPVLFGFSLGAVFCAVWPLYYPASTSHACDELLVAIAGLKQSRVPQAVAGAPRSPTTTEESQMQFTIKMASPQNLIRIEGICRYGVELNRGQGLGFTFERRRFDNTKVTRLLATLLLIVALMFPVMCVLFSSDAYLTVIPWAPRVARVNNTRA